VQHFGGFFHQIKVPANRKKGFYSNRDPNKQEVGGFFVFSNSSSKLRKQKQIALDVLFKSYPMIPLSG
jgi:hypothetical protein